MLQNLPLQDESDSCEGEITMEKTLGDMVGFRMLSAEAWESNGFHLVLLEPELGVFMLLTPDPADWELPELGVLVLLLLGVL